MSKLFFTKRPRNVGVLQAASILYGDWGTSKAYVIGLALAFTGHSSFWLIALVGILNILIGLNYMIICKYYPNGGGVYASVCHKSKALALVGAFCLIGDYLLTAGLSALSGFYYLGIDHPLLWAVLGMGGIGLLNYFGPRHTGNLATFIAIPTFAVVCLLALISFPFFPDAIQNIQPLKGGFIQNWDGFIGIIVALSGVESIANATGVMKLDPGTTTAKPVVGHTSSRAIAWVMVEVAVMTTVLGFAANALPGLVFENRMVISPENENVRDYLLRYMGQVFGGQLWGPTLGYFLRLLISIVFCALLLSAVNTAMVALSSLLFVLSRDGEMPEQFQRLNQFGVPVIPLIIATIVPMVVLLWVPDIAALADLYAIGFIGAIATNLAATSLDLKLPLKKFERVMMFSTFLIMAAVEISLIATKPHARNFAIGILAVGLLLREFVAERKKKIEVLPQPNKGHFAVADDTNATPLHEGAMLCVVSHQGKTLDFAIEECKNHHQLLCLLFIKEQLVMTEEDQHRSWVDDPEACKIFDYAQSFISQVNIKFFYVISDSSAHSIVTLAQNLKISRIILGIPRNKKILHFIRGNIVRDVSKILPPDIDLIAIS